MNDREPEVVSLREYVDVRWDAHTEVHEHLEKAHSIAILEITRRLDETNKLRGEVLHDRNQFVTKAEYEARHRELESKLEASNKRASALELWKSNLEGRLWMLGAVMTAVTVLLNLVFRLWSK